VESAWHQSMANAEGGALGWAHRRFARAALASESRWFPRFDRVLTTSRDDARLVRQISSDAHVSVYPNALPFFAPPARPERREIVFSGNLEYAPNIQAVRFFHRDVWPILKTRWPSLRWKILSRNAGAFEDLPASDPRIEITGFVEDAVTVIAESQVAVVPLLAGSGTRIKILEAWAAATPVVSTAIGAEGLEFRDGEQLILAGDSAHFAEAVSRLLESPADRLRIGTAGRLLYEERYTWSAAWKVLDESLGAALVDRGGETGYDYQ
jgi:polysaccharide biosynthesis protein PslH